MKKILFLLLFIPLVSFGQDLDLTSEQSFRDYFDKNGAELIEGIWGYSASTGNTSIKSISIF